MIGKQHRYHHHYVKGFSGNPYHDIQIFNYIYKKASPVMSNIDSGINKSNYVYKI